MEEEVLEIMAETMEQYMIKTHGKYRSGIARPKIDANAQFELKGQFLKELRDNTFSGSEHEDANEHIKKDFRIPNIRAFPVSLTGAASRWLINEPAGSITTWEVLKRSFLTNTVHLHVPLRKWRRKCYRTSSKEPMKAFFRALEKDVIRIAVKYSSTLP
ncbi:hypothetical protein Tco_1529413 [Tanacetum coccineum]